MRFSRRMWLGGVAATAVLGGLPLPALAAPETRPFDFNWLYHQARTIAQAPYQPPKTLDSPWLASLGYDAYRTIRFRSDQALWRRERRPFRAELFHPGALYIKPVDLFEVADGHARPIPFNPEVFDYGSLEVPPEVRAGKLGYAGFRIQHPLNRPDKFDEIMVFLGASYFRAVGRNQNYGLSARGLAIDTASARGEEFPDFRAFWLERPLPGARRFTVYALLDSPSMAGAYRFVVTPGDAVTMDVSARLFARTDIEKLGIAPLTSMYAHGENNNRLQQDFRPEVHDSDGLLLRGADDEWLWRPLTNPAQLAISTFRLDNAKGFGLLQRDRAFSSYQDLEAHYETRPSLWVEPVGNWGPGSVQLVEIPTDSEIHDNIVAYWIPGEPVRKGQELRLDYRLLWGNTPSARQRPLEVASTHVGSQFDQGATKFIIDYQGRNARKQQGRGAALRPDLWTSAGEISAPTLMPNPHTGGWRVAFDLRPEAGRVHELRCVLRQGGGQAVSETWTYQWRA